MKKTTLLLATTTLACHLNIALAHPPRVDQVSLVIQPHGSNLKLSWPGTVQAADGQTVQPFFELQSTTDLKSWQPLGERLRATPTAQSLQMTLPADQSRAFYRLLTSLPRTNLTLAATGAEVFGYGAAFARELQRIGQISPQEFAAMFPSGANYVPGISWDPTTAQYWEQFNSAPNFWLSEPELAVFTNQGFVVSERLGSGSFADVFYNLWHNDLPVFISTDAILQAWHRTYDAMLEELEETYLFNSAEKILAGMAAQVSAASAEAGNGVLRDSLLDVDYFLAVARSLLAESNGPVASALGQDARVAETLADIQAEQLKRVDDFMGFCRVVDFSQFKVRGHYTHSERLGRYFRCVMWLGRIDVPVAGGPWERCPGIERMASPRELGVAIVLWHLLQRSGEFNTWLNFDRVIQSFVGWTDSMNFAQLGGVLAGAGVHTLADVPDLASLTTLQTNILRGELGVQNIRSDYFVSPLGPEQIQLPRSFLVFGQKFVPDSWAFSQTVYDSILRVENGFTNKVPRRVPSALDAAFAVLGNNQVVPDLVARMTNTAATNSLNHAERWRDGLPYQHNLAAARAVMDAQEPAAWDSNIYLGWLAALRELSAPTTDRTYPEAMRTRAWSMKTLNTQLASWTQLRHDTILYAKQSHTGVTACFYPEGFVEPRTEFWQRLRATVLRATELISALPCEGTYPLVSWGWQGWDFVGTTNSIGLSVIQSNQVAHLRYFADTLATLRTLAEKELAQQCFSADEELFIRNLIQVTGGWGCDGPNRYDGWYPRLFYNGVQFSNRSFSGPEEYQAYFQENFGVNAADLIVADVHTDLPDDFFCDPGSVLHEGIGGVNLLMIAVENGGDRMVFAGPVLSHYEFEVIGDPRRLNDDEWKAMQWWNQFPPDVDSARVEGLAPPPWTSSYLVPR